MTRRSPSSPSGDSPGSFLRVTSRFGLVVGLLFCGAASAQSVDLDPAASFEPPGAPPLVGWRVGLDGDWVVLPAIAQRWAHQGFVHVYRRGTSGYELDATIEPSVCFPGRRTPTCRGRPG